MGIPLGLPFLLAFAADGDQPQSDLALDGFDIPGGLALRLRRLAVLVSELLGLVDDSGYHRPVVSFSARGEPGRTESHYIARNHWLIIIITGKNTKISSYVLFAHLGCHILEAPQQSIVLYPILSRHFALLLELQFE